MKTAEVVDIYKKLEDVKSKKLPIKVSFAIARNYRKMRDIIEAFDESRQEIIQRYGEKNDSGDLNISEDGDVKIINTKSFNTEMKALVSEDVTENWVKVESSAFDLCDGNDFDTLTVNDMVTLDFMIED